MKVTLQHKIWFQKASKKLQYLRPVFNTLRVIHKRYIEECDGKEWPYCYGERPHTGLFAAAVWQSGGIAFEEYRVSKRRGRKPETPGRCDLWIQIKDPTRGGVQKTDFCCEAKYCRLNLKHDATELADKAIQTLGEAIDDVKCHQDPRGLALCFVTPVIHRSKHSTLDANLEKWVDVMHKRSDWQALVWIGAQERQISWDTGVDHEYEVLFPGSLLMIAEVK